MKKKYLNFFAITKSIILVLLLNVIWSSCSNELDINDDPNKPTDVPLNVLLTASEANLAYTLGGGATRIPASIVQHYAGHRGQPLEYGQYNITASATDNLWTNLYEVMYDLRSIQSKAKESDSKIYLGISQILEAYTITVTTDLFGDVPYTEALQGSVNINPKYDTQESIYTSALKLIDDGIANVKANAGLKPGTDDLIYAGNITKWEKFGNSLKLRLLNHLSKRNPNAAKTFLDTNPALINSTSDNAKVVFGSSASNANPIHQFDVLSGRKDNAVCNTIVDKMKVYNDPRITEYFLPIVNGTLAGQIIGNKPGGDDDDSGEAKFSRVGRAFASVNSQVRLLSAAEVNFIKAEIYKRSSDDALAKVSYEKAISEDFVDLGISNVSSFLSLPEVSYNNTLQRIMEQKWVTMFQASFESWVDWRRTGYPMLTPATTNRTNGVIPRKLSLPQTEINLNADKVKEGPGIPVPFETLKGKVWWDQ